MNTCFLCYAALFAFTVSTAAETVFHVTSTGGDLNPGTRERPFATLEQARQAVRMAGPGTARRRVIVHGGSYELRSTFTLGPLDSGTATDRVSWQAANGVWLQGYWCYNWYDEVIQVAAIDPAARRITLAAPHVYSLMQGNPSPRRFRAVSLAGDHSALSSPMADTKTGRRTTSSWTANEPWAQRRGTTHGGGMRSKADRIASSSKSSSKRWI